jgi:hypothetical protein
MQQKNALRDQMRVVQQYTTAILLNVGVWKKYCADTFHSDWISKEQLSAWLDRIMTTISVLKYKYMCDESLVMDIAAVSSGLPRPFDIRLLEYEQKKMSTDGEESRISTKDLKRSFVEEICRKHSVNNALLDLIGKAYVAEIIMKSEIASIFRIVGFSEVHSTSGCKAYVCHWEQYPNQVTPVLYSMLFEYCDSGNIAEEILSELTVVLREETSNMPQLATLGRRIDQSIAIVRPKWIGRIIFGPVFISGFTCDEIDLQKIIDHVAESSGDVISASRMLYEYVISEGEDDARGLCDPRGNKHHVLQRFNPRHGDDECYDRGVTHVHKWLYAPHAVIQLMSQEYRHLINHEIIGDKYAK